MREDSIHNTIDHKILELFSDDMEIPQIQNYLKIKIRDFTSIFEKYGDTDVEALTKLNFDQLYPTRTKYGITYIKHSSKRIMDLDWVVENKWKFLHLSDSQVFKLVKLKDRLTANPSVISTH